MKWEWKSSVVVYSDKVPDNVVYEDDSSNTDSIKIYLYHQYGPDMYVDSKTVTGGTASNIIALLNQCIFICRSKVECNIAI